MRVYVEERTQVCAGRVTTSPFGERESEDMTYVRKLNVVGLLAIVLGLTIQISSGVDYPPIPPGAIIVVVAIALVAVTSWRWVSVIGVLVPLFFTFASFAVPDARENLFDPANSEILIGTLVFVTGAVVGLVSGIVVAYGTFARGGSGHTPTA